MNKLDLAEALIAIADTGSIQQAAMSLHQTNAAISKKLTKLEAHLGILLVHRQRKGLILTEAGQRYYHEAKKALAQFNVAEQSIVQAKVQPQGELKIVANQFYAQAFILPKLASFLKHYPKLKINLEIAEILPDFNTKKMDILFGVSALGAEQLVRTRFDSTRYVLCASPHYLKHKGVPSALSELLQHDFLAHSARKPNNLIILEYNKQIMMEPKLLLNNTHLLILAALEHLGFIWVHENVVSFYLAKKKLLCFLEHYTKQPIDIYAYYEQQNYHNPKIQAFINFFIDVSK
ncbi:LysR family transcriptional regulator [soil metagenome]